MGDFGGVGRVAKTHGVEPEHPPRVSVVVGVVVGHAGVLGEDRALRDARLDDRHSDAERRQFMGEFLAQALEGPLRGHVRRLTRCANRPTTEVMFTIVPRAAHACRAVRP
jgi:hypothetical protein